MITVEIPEGWLPLVRQNAKKSCIGGKSEFRTEDRKPELYRDQLIAQVGHMAASCAVFGSPRPYILARMEANKNPYKGDGGIDFLNTNIDVKSSRIHGPRPLEDYRLPVRPSVCQGRTYILVLVDLDNSVGHIMGEAQGKDFPKTPEVFGFFRGAFVLPARSLREIVARGPESGAST